MKNLKTLLLPAVMVLAGAGSAYASYVVKEKDSAIVRGYVYRSGEIPECVQTSKDCDTSGTFTCTADVGMGSEPLYELNGSVCPDQLKHTQPD